MSSPNSLSSPEDRPERSIEPRPPLTEDEAKYVADVLGGTAMDAMTPDGRGHRIESGPNSDSPESKNPAETNPVDQPKSNFTWKSHEDPKRKQPRKAGLEYEIIGGRILFPKIRH